MVVNPTRRRPVVALLIVSAALAGCQAKEQAASPPPAPPTTVAAATTTTTTTLMPEPPPVWRAARWGMKKAELLGAFPGEARRPATPADFGQPRPGASDVVIPTYEADGTTFRVLFGFGTDGLGRIQLSAVTPSASTCEDLEKRLTEEHGKASSRNDTGTSLRGQEALWTMPAETITLACSERPSLGYRSVTLDYVAASKGLPKN